MIVQPKAQLPELFVGEYMFGGSGVGVRKKLSNTLLDAG